MRKHTYKKKRYSTKRKNIHKTIKKGGHTPLPPVQRVSNLHYEQRLNQLQHVRIERSIVQYIRNIEAANTLKKKIEISIELFNFIYNNPSILRSPRFREMVTRKINEWRSVNNQSLQASMNRVEHIITQSNYI